MNNVQNYIMSKTARNPRSVCGDHVAALFLQACGGKITPFQVNNQQKKKKKTLIPHELTVFIWFT